MKKGIFKIFLVALVILSFASANSLFADPQLKIPIKKRITPTNLKLRNKTITGIVYEDGVYGRNVRRKFGMYDLRCNRIYINVPDAIAETINSSKLNHRKVKVTVSMGDYLKKGEATTNKPLTAIKVQFVNRHTFTGRVTLVNCNDGYFDFSYRFCNYGTYTVRVPLDSAECSRLNLQHNARISVDARGWSYSPRDTRITVARTLNVQVH